jgi:hypothetical protein
VPNVQFWFSVVVLIAPCILAPSSLFSPIVKPIHSPPSTPSPAHGSSSWQILCLTVVV